MGERERAMEVEREGERHRKNQRKGEKNIEVHKVISSPGIK